MTCPSLMHLHLVVVWTYCGVGVGDIVWGYGGNIDSCCVGVKKKVESGRVGQLVVVMGLWFVLIETKELGGVDGRSKL